MNKIAVVCHPKFLSSTSMPKFADMIVSGLESKGIEVVELRAKPFAFKLPVPLSIKKWFGYFDQYFLFNIYLLFYSLVNKDVDLYVFCDQALGPNVPFVLSGNKVVHVHDFMALKSALGEYSYNKLPFSGRIYQNLIRRSFSRARNFISVSEATQDDLHRFLLKPYSTSYVVLNGLNYDYHKVDLDFCKTNYPDLNFITSHEGYILHVGGNQWYKNRFGLVVLYNEYVKTNSKPLKLVMVGPQPTEQIKNYIKESALEDNIIFVVGASNDVLRACYSNASLFLFPSIAEGFGWPIIEAISCQAKVLTCDDAPMNQIGGRFCNYVKSPLLFPDLHTWAASECIKISDSLVNSVSYAQSDLQAYLSNFDANTVLDKYINIYESLGASK